MPIAAEKNPRCSTRPAQLAIHKMLVLEGLAATGSIEEASWGADVGRSTVEKWRNEDPDFNDACNVAVADGYVPEEIQAAIAFLTPA